ncbi:MAG: AAA family ATPase [Chloroflexota bacterium]|nr:AAA family ATPase [Chloroflexota bacterium]
MPEHSKLVRMRIANLGCVGPEGLTVELDNILCLVGANNSGKSTVLRAYELAVGSETFSSADLCQRAEDNPATVEIWVHIPEGTPNIAEKWKTSENGLLLVRSKWEWSKENSWKKVRRTWDPELDDYAEDGKASGLDTVFSSRLPTPFRIGSLQDPKDEHQKLLTLILQPIADKLDKHLLDETSELSKALAAVTEHAKKPVEEEADNLAALKTDINSSHNAIFPDLSIDFAIEIGDIQIEPIKELLKNSRLKFQEWMDEIDWNQQGTGSQRALFWTMLQVRSRLKALSDLKTQNEKELLDCQKKIKKLQSDADKAKKEETKQSKYEEIAALQDQMEQLEAADCESQLEEKANELSLPGYMLLIDEPEIALHPNAIRAASKYLYGLAEDPSWQIMLATHSPLFLDPLQDHTTIIRLYRSAMNPTPCTFRSDSIAFSPDEKENLKMLNRFDQGLAEMFFGQRPVLIEGDTEFAAFEFIMNSCPDDFPANKRPTLVRARGKYTLKLLIKILREFKVPFSVLHDADYPVRADGASNNAWSANSQIYDEITETRSCSVDVIHRVSVPNFEFAHAQVEVNENGHAKQTPAKDKPWKFLDGMKSTTKVESSVKTILNELLADGSTQEPFEGQFNERLREETIAWAAANSPGDPKYVFP